MKLVASLVLSLLMVQVSLGQTSSLSDTLLLEPVEIRAIRASEKSPMTQTTLNAQQLRHKNLGQDIPYLINDVPGVVTSSDAGTGIGYTGLRIRGTDATRINITLNGIPFNDAESQGAFFVDLPDFASSVSTLQVQRGVGTSSNGPGAFGASINLSTNEVNKKFYAETAISGGSFDTWKHTFKVASGLIGKHLTIDGRLSYITSDGYIDRASANLKSAYSSVAWITNKNSFRINVFTGDERTYQAWYGVPEKFLTTNRTYNSAGLEQPFSPYKDEVDKYNQTHYQGFYNQKLSNRWNLQTAFFFTRGKGYYEQYKADELLSSYGRRNVNGSNGVITTTDLTRRLYLDNDFYGNTFSFQYRDNVNEYTLGGGLNRYNGKHFGEVRWAAFGIPANHRWYDVDAYKTDLNLYGKMLHKVREHLFAFADLQLRTVRYSLNGFRKNPSLSFNNKYQFVNPKVGLSWIEGNNKVYLSYAQANKEPNRDDLETGASEQPLPERLHDFELGFEKKEKQYQINATGYFMDYDNQLVLTGKINDVGAYTRTNIKSSYRAGVELEGRFRLHRMLSLYSNVALSTNKIRNFTEFMDDYDNGGQISQTFTKSDISFSPSITTLGRVIVEPTSGLAIHFDSRYVGRQYLDNTSNKTRSLNPYFLQDVVLMYNVKKKVFSDLNFVLQLNNVFNEMYEPNGYTFSYIYGGKVETENFYFPMAGRNFMVGVQMRID
jgi:iron complex outermembrane recepter protein